jgi:hypothetical protein
LTTSLLNFSRCLFLSIIPIIRAERIPFRNKINLLFEMSSLSRPISTSCCNLSYVFPPHRSISSLSRIIWFCRIEFTRLKDSSKSCRRRTILSAKYSLIISNVFLICHSIIRTLPNLAFSLRSMPIIPYNHGGNCLGKLRKLFKPTKMI